MRERKNSRVDNGNASRFNPAALVAAMFQRIPSAHTQSRARGLQKQEQQDLLVLRSVGLSIGDFRLSATCLSINKSRDATGYKERGIRYNERVAFRALPLEIYLFTNLKYSCIL
jgi:hypothetical protein